ncbi:MAG: hypothetical protein WA208_21850, partial [Thermoanaerobaculia bacterium]
LLDHADGVTELVMHPAVGVSGYAWGYDWQRELGALSAPSLRGELEKRGIVLAAPSSVAN